MWVVLLGYGCNLTRPASYKTMPGRVHLGYCSWSQWVSGVDSSVQVQCSIASKAQSAELKSSETLVCVYIGGCLMQLINHVSSWGTTITDTCILWEMGLFIPPFAILKTESREVLIEYVWVCQWGTGTCTFYYLHKMSTIWHNKKCSTGNTIRWSMWKFQLIIQIRNMFMGTAQCHLLLLSIRKKYWLWHLFYA